MKSLKLSFFELLALLWLDLLLFALILAFLGLFYWAAIVVYFVIAVILAALMVKTKTIKITPMSLLDKIVLSVIFAASLFLSSYTTPTIFGGRDEGSLANAGILLAQNHSLTHSNILVEEFSKIYGPSKALNFPGFYYPERNELKSQFLPAYPIWLGVCYSALGLEGLRLANLVPWTIFLFCFYLVLKRFCKKNLFCITGLILLVTSFPIFVFYKFTLTEIFFASLMWLCVHFLLRYREKKTYINYLLIFAPLLIAPFARIESLGFILFLFFLLAALDFENLKKAKYQLAFFMIGLAIALSIATSPSFFIETFKGFAELPNSTEQSNEPVMGEPGFSFIPDDWKNFYLLKILFNYNILPFLVLATVTVLTFLRKKAWNKLIPFLLLCPALVYLLDANISLDHPWMLRRYVFAVIPLAILYSVILLEKVSVSRHWFVWTVITFLLMINVSLTAPFVTASQNQNLLSQVQQLSEQFQENDLILVSQQSSGPHGWSLISEPLRNIYGHQTIYFHNPNDYQKIDLSRFNDVYLISSSNPEELELFKNLPKQKVSDYTIQNQIISPSRNALQLPQWEFYTVEGGVWKVD